MRILVVTIVVLIGWCSNVFALEADSVADFPDSITLNFSVYGSTFDFHHIDPNRGPNPGDHYTNSQGWMTFPSLFFNRFDGNWHYVDSTQTWLNQYNNDYQYKMGNGGTEIKLDTLTHRILQITITQNFGIKPEDLHYYTFAIGGLQYSNQSLFVKDSDVVQNLITATYKHTYGLHSDDYGYTNFGNAIRVRVTGMLQYEMHDLGPVIAPTITPAKIDFDTIAAKTSKTMSVVLTDTSTRRIIFTGVGITSAAGNPFSSVWSGNSYAIVDSGKSITLNVTFAPAIAGAFSGEARVSYINADGSVGTFPIPLSGVATVAASVINSTTDAHRIHITAIGTGAVQLETDGPPIGSLRIVDYLGRSVYQTTTNESSIRISDLHAGYYVASVGSSVLKFVVSE